MIAWSGSGIAPRHIAPFGYRAGTIGDHIFAEWEPRGQKCSRSTVRLPTRFFPEAAFAATDMTSITFIDRTTAEPLGALVIAEVGEFQRGRRR